MLQQTIETKKRGYERRHQRKKFCYVNKDAINEILDSAYWIFLGFFLTLQKLRYFLWTMDRCIQQMIWLPVYVF